jgi:hypothetical protein
VACELGERGIAELRRVAALTRRDPRQERGAQRARSSLRSRSGGIEIRITSRR